MSGKTFVLIADDDSAICFALAAAVRQQQLTPLIAADGITAVEIVDRYGARIVAAFVDWRMPRLDGLGFLLALRQNNNDLPCCLMSAFRPPALNPGSSAPFEFLLKPFDLDQFFHKLTMLGARPNNGVEVTNDESASLRDSNSDSRFVDSVCTECG